MKRFFSSIRYIEGQTTKPNICKDCKYFKPDYISFIFNNHYNLGRCKKILIIDVISGKSTPEYANVVRDYECKGNYFESKYTLKN